MLFFRTKTIFGKVITNAKNTDICTIFSRSFLFFNHFSMPVKKAAKKAVKKAAPKKAAKKAVAKKAPAKAVKKAAPKKAAPKKAAKKK